MNFTEMAGHKKEALPKGRLNIRHRQMRGVYQVFAGNFYINAASGNNYEEAAKALASAYEVDIDSSVTLHGQTKEVVQLKILIKD